MAQLAVLLMDYGAPSLDAEVRPFIASLLSDPAILPLPWGLRQLLAGTIARRRAPQVIARYRAIGGSPLPREAEALATALGARLGPDVTVRPAFCHAPPFIEAVVETLAAEGIERVVGLPLFPQRSWTTADICHRRLRAAGQRRGLTVTSAEDFAEEAGWIEAMAAATRPLLPPVGRRATHLLMVAHGLPERLARAGDPYPERVRASASALMARLPAGTPWSLAFQSRLGRATWTGPYLEDELARVAGEGAEDLVLVPLSFATENLETRWDLDHEASERARALGVIRVQRAPVPSAAPGFVKTLADLARRAVSDAGWEPVGGVE